MMFVDNNYMSQKIFDALSKADIKEALVVNGVSYSYQELSTQAYAFAYCLRSLRIQRLAILAHRSFAVYQSVLASIMEHSCYVPLNSLFPEDKSAFILEHSEADCLVLSPECYEYATTMILKHCSLETLNHAKLILSPKAYAFLDESLASNESKHHAVLNNAIKLPCELHELDLANDKLKEFLVNLSSESEKSSTEKLSLEQNEPLVYHYQDSLSLDNPIMHILYTSGTTGSPKGVAVSYANYACYFEQIERLYQIQEQDRLSHFAEITFDISLQDPLLAFCAHATLICPSKNDLISTYRYLAVNKISVLHTVPSSLSFLMKILQHKKDIEPLVNLRLAIFIGEALWSNQVAFFKKITPNAVFYNTYGPTETTVAVTYYRLTDKDYADSSAAPFIISIGQPLPQVKYDIVDGELLIGGPQVTLGYLKNPEKNAITFIEHKGERYYRTGDSVKEEILSTLIAQQPYLPSFGAFVENPSNSSNNANAHANENTSETSNITLLHYLGRDDDMIKLHGYRISLYEIDEKLSELTNKPVRALAYDLVDKQQMKIVAVVENATDEEIAHMKRNAPQKLSFYMLPSDIYTCDSFPLNSNGKVDRKALKVMFKEQALAD